MRSRAGRSVATVLLVSTGAVLASTTPSFASPAAGHTLYAGKSAYCSLFQTYSKNETNASKVFSSPTAVATEIKAAFSKLKGVESEILGIAPASIHGDYVIVFNALNTMYADLAKSDYSFMKLAESKTTLANLEALSKTLGPASAKITAYDKNVCGVKG